MKDFETDDELFIELQGERPIEVLATARSKITGKDHPMAFVLNYGKGRVFHTTLGHDAKSLRLPGPSELIRRGASWAAR
jgi:type 1 glutamine amidotransferase